MVNDGISWMKYPKIEYLGSDENKHILDADTDEIVMEEKVDGGNMSLMLSDGKIEFFSRNQKLDDKMFKASRAWILENVKPEQLNASFIYYCEAMQLHTIAYTSAPPVLGLDIRLTHSMNGSPKFISYDAKIKEFSRIGIAPVKLLHKARAIEIRKMSMQDIPKSEYYEGVSEGIVLKNYGRLNEFGRQMFAKVVTEQFKEQNKAVFGAVKKPIDDTSKIVDEFVTEARIRKITLNVINETGSPLGRELMKYVPIEVARDILSESAKELLRKYSYLDLQVLKKRSAKASLEVIDKMLIEHALKHRDGN